MNATQAARLENVIRNAVNAAIKEAGIGALKATSMFLSNERSSMKKAA